MWYVIYHDVFFSFSILFSSHYFPSCGFICPKLVFRWNSVLQFPKASLDCRLLQWYASESDLKVMNDFLYRGKNLQSSASVVFCVAHFCDIRRLFFFQIYLYSVSCVSLTLNLILRVTKCKAWNQLYEMKWQQQASPVYETPCQSTVPSLLSSLLKWLSFRFVCKPLELKLKVCTSVTLIVCF